MRAPILNLMGIPIKKEMNGLKGAFVLILLMLLPLSMIAPSLASDIRIKELFSPKEYPYDKYYEDFVCYIKAHEGYSDTVYICPAGYRTIGYGYKLRKGDDIKHLSFEQADALLRKCFNQAIQFTRNENLPKSYQIPIAHFIYCLGYGTYRNSSVRIAINQHIATGNDAYLRSAISTIRKYNKYKSGGVYRKSKALDEQRNLEAMYLRKIMFNNYKP